MSSPKLAAVPRLRYAPVLSETEHRAYAAAYRIIDAPGSAVALYQEWG